MSDIFISYAREDQRRAEMLAQTLEDYGWSIFWDRTIPIGKTWRETIGRELRSARCAIVLWSETSIVSDWVQEEADDAKNRGVLVPVLIEKIQPPIGFRSIQAADLVDWDTTVSTHALRKLIADIAALIGPPPKKAETEGRQATQEAAVPRRKAAEGDDARPKIENENKRERPSAQPSPQAQQSMMPLRERLERMGLWWIIPGIAITGGVVAVVAVLLPQSAPVTQAPVTQEPASPVTPHDADAMTKLGDNYRYGQEGVAQDYSKAREWYEKAAAQSNAKAMFNLGLLYEWGQGVALDYGKAREWYEKAAAKDEPAAMVNLGLLYETGRGVARDDGKAREWFEKAAAKGNADAKAALQRLAPAVAPPPPPAVALQDADAMTKLGDNYRYGQEGVAQDYGKAREWYEKAAAKGESKAMVSLGFLYTFGHPQDYAKAREWYEKAAAQSNSKAMTELGKLYENGLGVAEDYEKARAWYGKAAAIGNDEAKARLDKLGTR
jgi:TPR repeat protein